MRVLAIIPARGGSKGVPGKNIADLGGKPLVQHAVDCALGSKHVEKAVVTSDSEQILSHVHDHPKVAKVLRPADLATDSSNVVTAVNHVLELFPDFDLIVLVQPTAPLRTSVDLDNVVQMMLAANTDAVVSVVMEQDSHPARMYSLSPDRTMVSLEPDRETMRRQDLPPVYLRNGCFYAIRTDIFKSQQTFMPARKKAYVMDADWLANVDMPRDLVVARALYPEWIAKNGDCGNLIL